MKLREGFITHTSGGEHILLSTNDNSFNGLVRSNETAAFIIEQLKSETTLEQILDALLGEYEVSREVAREGVETILSQLQAIGALDT